MFMLAHIQMSQEEVKEKDSGFVLVRAKKSKHSKSKISNVTNDCSTSNKLVSNSPDTVYTKTVSAQSDISNSLYYTHLLESLHILLKSLRHNKVKEIVCYGLGQFSQCVSARYQFGLLLALKEHLSAPVFIHDPIFNKIEIEVIEKLQCNIIEENEEGKRKINDITLVYLPHCPKQLTNNFLWCNWGRNLNSCVLISNSFTKIIESHSDRFLEQNIKYIFNIFPSIVEVEVKNTFKYSDIFNDLSFHIFPKENLDRITESTWESKLEPTYKSEDLEFVTQEFKKKLSL